MQNIMKIVQKINKHPFFLWLINKSQGTQEFKNPKTKKIIWK